MSTTTPTSSLVVLEPQKALGQPLDRFLDKMEGIKTAYEIVVPLIAKELVSARTAFDEFVNEAGITKTKHESTTSFNVPVQKYSSFQELEKKKSSLGSALLQTPRALLVAMVSCYDAFLGDLLKGVFYLKPEMVNSSQRELKFEDLLKLGSIEGAREFLVEKEVESVIRESHTKQFEWMETRFGLPLRKDLSVWPTFIELTERRNLLVHTDGLVSRQYLEVCLSQAVDITNLQVGEKLSVDTKYFSQGFSCLFEIAVKLTQVIWRKLAPQDIENADTEFISVTFNLLKHKRYPLAKRLLEFATKTLKKHSSNLTKRIFTINHAIALKWGGEPEKAKALIEAEDWSDCAEHFKMAVAVLGEEFKAAAKIMHSLGAAAKGVSRVGYETWPLFQDFRKTEEFKKEFRAVYGEDLRIDVEAPKETKEQLNNVNDASRMKGSAAPLPSTEASNEQGEVKEQISETGTIDPPTVQSPKHSSKSAKKRTLGKQVKAISKRGK